jgi:hypothetical protein
LGKIMMSYISKKENFEKSKKRDNEQTQGWTPCGR